MAPKPFKTCILILVKYGNIIFKQMFLNFNINVRIKFLQCLNKLAPLQTFKKKNIVLTKIFV